MGTFHEDAGALHGMTVVAEAGDTVYVGRCDSYDDTALVLLDADAHTEGVDTGTRGAYLAKAARYGFWKRHDRIELPADRVERLTSLSSHFRSDGRTAFRSEAEAAPPEPEPEPTPAPPAEAAAGPVRVTNQARREVARLLESQDDDARDLRLSVCGGGCSGLVYKVEFDARREGDLVMAEDGFDIVLDPKSLIYLRGTTLDFQGGLEGRGFRFDNPNASNTCGCGESFAV